MRRRLRDNAVATPSENLVDVDQGDVTRVTMPEGVPQNADGTVLGEGDIPTTQAQKIGALDEISAATNKDSARKMREAALGKPVRWNEKDALKLFSQVKGAWPGEWSSTLIYVSRAEPAPNIQYPPISAANLKDPMALYDYVKSCHGQYQSTATYKIDFRSNVQRGSASITLDAATSPVQVVRAEPQGQGYGPQGGPQGYGGGYGPQGGYGPSGGQGYPQGYPQQSYPQGQGRTEVVVVQQPVPPAPGAPPPSSPMPMPYPPPGSFDPQQAMFTMMSQMMERQAVQAKELVETLRKPPPPPGFIPLPDDWVMPLPAGFMRIPGGMIPVPSYALPPAPVVAPAAAAPAPVHQAYPVPAGYPYPASAAAPAAAPATAMDPLAGTIKQVASAMRGFQELQTLFGGNPGAQVGQVIEEEEPEPPNPIQTQDVGGVTMVIRDGKTDWAATAVGAIPKMLEGLKAGVAEYQKVVNHQAALTSRAVAERKALADSVVAAQRVIQTPPTQIAAAPQPPRPPPSPQATLQAAHAAAPASTPPAAPAPKRSVAVPSVPLW